MLAVCRVIGKGEMMDFNQLKKRYIYNVEFHALVEHFYHLYYENRFTFFEVKEAMIFAKNKFDMENGSQSFRGRL